MRKDFAFSASLLLALLAIVAVSCNSVTDHKSWKKIENHEFSFLLPPSFRKTDTQGIDSFVEEYVSDGINLSFDLGMYSNNFYDWPKETKYESLKIDGKPAKLGTAVFGSRTNFPILTQVYINLGRPYALSMHAACKSDKEVVLARKIFGTITFKKQKT